MVDGSNENYEEVLLQQRVESPSGEVCPPTFQDKTDRVIDPDEPIKYLVDLIILEAYRASAKQIRLVPEETKLAVFYDGEEVDSPPPYLQDSIIRKIKHYAHLFHLGQQGNIEAMISGELHRITVTSKQNQYGEELELKLG